MTRIVLFGDLHYPALPAGQTRLEQAKSEFFDHYLSEVFAAKADYHVSIGDLAHSGHPDEFRDVAALANRHNARFRLVLGNHDVIGIPKRDIQAIVQQPLYEHIQTADAHLVFLDTTIEHELHGWGVDQRQWEWLRDTCASLDDRPLLVFGHHPVKHTTIGSPAEHELTSVLQDISGCMSQYRGQGLYFNGHIHQKSIVQKGSWLYYQTSSVLYAPTYHVIEALDGQIAIRTVSVPLDSKQREARDMLFHELQDFHRVPGLEERVNEDITIRTK